jgi:hypothetical protein
MPTVIILLSDGHITTGPERDVVLEEIPRRANEMGAVICTVGIGETESHVDWPLLKGMAQETNGEYLFADSGEELLNFFIACRQGVVGEVVQIGGMIEAGQTSAGESVTIHTNVCEASMALNYISGDPELIITDPQGVVLDSDYAGFSHQTSENLKLYTLLKPISGDWNVSVNSGDLADEDIVYSIVITSQDCPPQTPTPTSPPTPTPVPTPVPASFYFEQALPVIPLLILLLIVGVIFVVGGLRQKK